MVWLQEINRKNIIILLQFCELFYDMFEGITSADQEYDRDRSDFDV